LKEISKKFASASTVIGLARIVRAESRFMKICWVVMTFISLMVGLYLTSGTIKDYLEHKVFTETKYISSKSIILPSVTFCFIKPETKDLYVFFEKAEFYYLNGSNTNLTGDPYYNKEFEYWGFANCIKFNHFNNKSRTKLFFAESSGDYLNFEIDLRTKFNDIRVFLSDNYNNILDWSQYVTLSYHVKGYYEMAIKKEADIKLEEPYNPCKNISDITYRQADCIVQCKNINFASSHNCTLGNFYSIPGYSFCEDRYFNLSKFDSDCLQQCPKECTTRKFNILLNNPNLSSNYSNKLTFHIWYLDLSFVEIRQTSKMSGFSLLNEIGGALGLFVGISFLSVLELLEFFLNYFYYLTLIAFYFFIHVHFLFIKIYR